MKIEDLWKYDLRQGNTDHPANGACLYDAAKWIVYGQIGDDPQCACPIIREYAIGLNDHMPHEPRQLLLKPMILRVVGNIDPAAEMGRLHHIVLETARRIVPLASNSPAFQAMRNLPDDASFEEIKDAAADAAYAAKAAYAAARAANSAADAADAAKAAYAADAAKAAYAADAAVWPVAVDILDGALRIGKQAPDFAEDEVVAAIEAFERAREYAEEGGQYGTVRVGP